MSEIVQGYFQRAQALDRRAYISRSKLDLALQGLEFFYSMYGEGIYPPSNPGQVEGQRLHLATLEPDEWRRLKCVHRFENFKTKEAQDWLRRIERENPGAIILSPNEALRYERIVDRIRSHKLAGSLLSSSRTELHGYATCPRTGALLYSRPDILTPERWIGDLKFCRNVDAFAFNRDQFRDRYYMQLAFYNHVDYLISGIDRFENCFWIAVEINYPHRIKVHTMASDFQKMGDALWNHALDKILACLAKDPTMKNFEVWREHSNKPSGLTPEPWMAMNDPLLMEAVATGA